MGEGENSIIRRRPKLNTTNPWKQEKDKIVGGKKKVQNRFCPKTKPASLTSSNTGSLRSFYRDTTRSTRYCGTDTFYSEKGVANDLHMSNHSVTIG